MSSLSATVTDSYSDDEIKVKKLASKPATSNTREEDSRFCAIGNDLMYTVEEAVEKLGFGPFQILVTVFAGMIWLADAMEVMLLSVLSPNLKCWWDLSEGEEAAITSVVFIGFFFGSFVWGVICDSIGRKKGLLLVNVVILIFGILSAIPITSDPYAKFPSYPWLLLCRAGVGFGAGGAGQAVTYYAEFLPNRARGICLTLQEFWWALGSVLGAGLAVFVMVPGGLGWHWYLGLSTIPLFLALLMFFFIPESARFYIIKGKRKQALKVMKIIARYNRRTLPKGILVSFEEKNNGGTAPQLADSVKYKNGSVVFSESFKPDEEESPLLDEKTIDTPTMHESHCTEICSKTTDQSFQYNCIVMCKNGLNKFFTVSFYSMLKKRMWITTLLLFCLWFGAAWLYYGTVLLTTSFIQNDQHCGYGGNDSNMSAGCEFLELEDYLTVLWTSLAEVPGLLVTMLFIEIAGRKFTMAVEFVFTMIGFLLLLVCVERWVLTLFLFLIRAFATGVFQAIYVYTPEVYPTSVRAFALGTCSAFARIGAITTPYIAQVLIEHSDVGTVSLYAGSCLVLAIISCLLPIETKGRPLTDESN